MKKTFICILLAIISGGILGKLTFDKYQNLDIKKVIKLDNDIYALKYKTYSSKEEMEKSMIDNERYIYIKKDDNITSYVAVAKTLDSIKKINKLYDDKYKIKKITINNNEFIQNLDEYEKLLNASNDRDSINVIENQILSSYEKLVVNNE